VEHRRAIDLVFNDSFGNPRRLPSWKGPAVSSIDGEA
jgi:hypothetical protein